MEELRNKIANYRRFMFRKEFLKMSDSEIKEKAIVLKKTAQEALKAHPNKQEAYQVWTDEFTGRHDG